MNQVVSANMMIGGNKCDTFFRRNFISSVDLGTDTITLIGQRLVQHSTGVTVNTKYFDTLQIQMLQLVQKKKVHNG